jgi:hypothetical protein
MKRTAVIISLAAIVGLSACAQRASTIAPASMPAGMYSDLSCSQARQERLQVQATLDSMSAAQDRAATGDAIGVFLLGVPWSSLSGRDQSGMIATERGKLLALDARLSRC